MHLLALASAPECPIGRVIDTLRRWLVWSGMFGSSVLDGVPRERPPGSDGRRYRHRMPTESELRAALERVALERVARQPADARANAPRRSAVNARSSGPPSVVHWLEMLAAGMVRLDD